MATEQLIGIAYFTATVIPILWSYAAKSEETRIIFWYISAGFLMMGSYSIRSVIETEYPGVGEGLLYVLYTMGIIIIASMWFNGKRMMDWFKNEYEAYTGKQQGAREWQKQS